MAQWGSLRVKYAPVALKNRPRGLRWFYSLLRPRKGALKGNPLRESCHLSAVTERGYPCTRCPDWNPPAHGQFFPAMGGRSPIASEPLVWPPIPSSCNSQSASVLFRESRGNSSRPGTTVWPTNVPNSRQSKPPNSQKIIPMTDVMGILRFFDLFHSLRMTLLFDIGYDTELSADDDTQPCTNWVWALPRRLLCLLSWRSKKVRGRSRKVTPIVTPPHGLPGTRYGGGESASCVR